MKESVSDTLLEMIEKKEAKIAVFGLGAIGLPTAALFASLGFQVTGIDVNSKIVRQINEGKLQTREFGLQTLVIEMRQKGLLSAVVKPSEALTEADIVIICVQTPLDKQRNADLSFLQKACEGIAQVLKRNKLVVIQSTVPPKTTTTLVIPILEQESQLKCGVDFWLVYCPERMAPGNGLCDLAANPRLIGAYDSKSAALGSALFKVANDGRLMVTDILSAEVAKLAENTFRYVNIAFANELALICRQVGVDAQEVIKLANTHPRVKIHQPGCGAGGPCLSKDTHLLLSSAGPTTFGASVLPAAIKVNNFMPVYVVKLASEALSRIGKRLDGSRVAVFGTAYKGGVNDSRNSPSEGIIRELSRKKAKIVTFDPHCAESFGAEKAGTEIEAVKGADCIIIATDHKEFYKLDLAKMKRVMNDNPIIVDCKRIINCALARSLGFDYAAISLSLDESKILLSGEDIERSAMGK